MTLTLGNIKTIALYLSNENIGNLDPYGVVYKRNYIIEGWSYLLLSHHCVVYTTQNVTQAIDEENF